jgi:membrane glycosyltransferase
VYLKEGYSDAFLEQCRRMVCEGKDTTMNYMSRFIESDIVTYIKIKRLGWAGHVIRMDKGVFNTKPTGIRKIRRPKLRWEDGVIQDIKTFGVKNWRNIAM